MLPTLSSVFGFIPGPGLSPVFALVLTIIIVWSFIWKGLALWRAARLGQSYWFVALLVLNTVGILEILYLFVFSKPESSAPKPPSPSAG